MKPSLASRADNGKLDGSGSGGASGRILYKYSGRGDGAGIFRSRDSPSSDRMFDTMVEANDPDSRAGS